MSKAAMVWSRSSSDKGTAVTGACICPPMLSCNERRTIGQGDVITAALIYNSGSSYSSQESICAAVHGFMLTGVQCISVWGNRSLESFSFVVEPSSKYNMFT